MQKLISALLIGAIIVCIAACGGKDTEESFSTADATPEPAIEESREESSEPEESSNESAEFNSVDEESSSESKEVTSTEEPVEEVTSLSPEEVIARAGLTPEIMDSLEWETKGDYYVCQFQVEDNWYIAARNDEMYAITKYGTEDIPVVDYRDVVAALIYFSDDLDGQIDPALFEQGEWCYQWLQGSYFMYHYSETQKTQVTLALSMAWVTVQDLEEPHKPVLDPAVLELYTYFGTTRDERLQELWTDDVTGNVMADWLVAYIKKENGYNSCELLSTMEYLDPAYSMYNIEFDEQHEYSILMGEGNFYS